MKIVFSAGAWEDYLYWQTHDPDILARLNGLIKETSRDPHRGTGKPEPLRGNLSGWWSRRITREHRLVYRAKDGELQIAQCWHHY